MTHGLNLRPAKMFAYAALLSEMNFWVLNVTLTGHGDNFDEFKAVRLEDWQNDFQNTYCIAKSEAVAANVPINALTYSTGGTVTLLAQRNHPDLISFANIIHVAPAFALSFQAGLVRLLSPLNWLNLPSQNLVDYRAHPSTPMPAYKALLGTLDAADIATVHDDRIVRTPTLVILDQKDEVISTKKILTQTRRLKWSTFLVDGDFAYRNSRVAAPHHAILNEELVGPKSWQEIRSALHRFLK